MSDIVDIDLGHSDTHDRAFAVMKALDLCATDYEVLYIQDEGAVVGVMIQYLNKEGQRIARLLIGRAQEVC